MLHNISAPMHAGATCNKLVAILVFHLEMKCKLGEYKSYINEYSIIAV